MADEKLKEFYDQEAKKASESKGEKVVDSINEDFELKKMMGDYLNNPNPDLFMQLFDGIKKGSKISIASLSETIDTFRKSKNYDLTNDEEQMCAILMQIIKEKLVDEEIRNYRCDPVTGRLIQIEDETNYKVK